MRDLRWIDAVAWAVMIGVVVLRALGPSDLHDQTQPRTIAYTVDLALHPEHWALPVESGDVPATKPPMYNWIAAPFVRLTEGRSELAHKAPSVLAFLALGAIVWSIGRRIRPGSPIGGFALLVFATNYAWFKLGYLARPDALLSLWLIAGWMAATALIARDVPALHESPLKRNAPLKLALWLSVAAAILTKGPAALVVPIYAAALGIVIELRNDHGHRSRPHAAMNGACNALRLTGAWWGIPLALAIAGAWLAAAYATNGAHVREIMLGRELVGHIVGGAGEAQESVPFDLVRTAFDMPLYFLSRFLPWSVLFLAACWDLFRPPAPNLRRGFPAEVDDDNTGGGNIEARRWIPASMLYAAVVVVFFSFAATKRADYIASAFAPAAIVVGWWAWERGLRVGRRLPWLIPVVSAATLAALATHDHTIGFAARYPAADAYWRFADRARPLIASDPAALLLLETRPDPMPSLLYRNQFRSTPQRVASDLAPYESAWIIGPSHFAEPVFTAQLEGAWQIEEALAVRIPKSAEPYPAYILKLYRATRR